MDETSVPSRWRKKPVVVIEAIQWDGHNSGAVLKFCFSDNRWKDGLPDDGDVGGPGIGYTPSFGTLHIPTLEGVMTAQPGDWIIRGVKGELYPCKSDVFDATYEPVTEESPPDDNLSANDAAVGGWVAAANCTIAQSPTEALAIRHAERRGEAVKRCHLTLAAVALCCYVVSIVTANYLIVHGMPGATLTPFHTYTLPVGFGLTAPAGTYVAALSFPLRDIVQRVGGRWLGVVAIALAAIVSWWVSSPVIALASGGTFLISETCDFLVYTPLQRRWFAPAVVASGVVSAVVDSLIFLKWAGIGYGHGQFEGLVVGKLWIVTLLGGGLAYGARRVLPNRTSAVAG